MDLRIMIASFGALALVGAFWRMNKGFGPSNIKVIGIVVIATFASLLAAEDSNAMTAAIGLLGAIAGYLFGLKDAA